MRHVQRHLTVEKATAVCRLWPEPCKRICVKCTWLRVFALRWLVHAKGGLAKSRRQPTPRSFTPAVTASGLRSSAPLEGGGQNRSESFAPIVGPALVGQAEFRIRLNPFDCPLALLRDELTLVAELAPELSRQDKEARPWHLGLSIHH